MEWNYFNLAFAFFDLKCSIVSSNAEKWDVPQKRWSNFSTLLSDKRGQLIWDRKQHQPSFSSTFT